jgi:hypothetical protein
MKRVLLGLGWALVWVVGAFLVVRAIAEPLVVDVADPASYRDDWGGPGLTGVLAVHMLPGVVAAALMALAVRRRQRGRKRDRL